MAGYGGIIGKLQTSIFNGSGVPLATLGNINDYYLNLKSRKSNFMCVMNLI